MTKLSNFQKSSPRDLFRFATKLDYYLLIFGIVLSSIQGILSACSPVIFRHLTDALVLGQLEWNLGSLDYYEFYQLAMRAVYKYFAFGCLLLIVGFLSMSCWHSLAERQAYFFRIHFLSAVLRQNAAWFDANETGMLSNRMNDGVERIRDGMGDKMGIMIAYCTQFITGITIAMILSWKLSVGMALLCPFFFGPLALVYRGMSKVIPKEQMAFGRASAVLEEVLHGIRTVIAFNGQDKEVKRYESELRKAAQFGAKKGSLTAAGSAVIYTCLFIAMSCAFWYGTRLVISHEITPGILFAVFWAIVNAAFAMGQTAPLLAIFSSALTAAKPILDVIDCIPDIDATSEEGMVIDKIQGNIRIEEVSFTYPSRDTPALKNISIDIKRGSNVALVGHSGSGKSTLIQLLTREYLEQEGKISIDSRPLSFFNVKSLRQFIGVVSQEPCLFNGTITNNIRLGRDDLSFEDIQSACRMANAHSFISSLPDGYNTLIGNGGVQLSGGQRQRIAIARAFVKNPGILILDEATSALDAESEATVLKAKGVMTIISIAHRLNTVKKADCIYVFQDGKIVEKGTHSELLSLNGAYSRLVELQEIETIDRRQEEEVLRKSSHIQDSFLRKASHRLSRGIARASIFTEADSVEKLQKEGVKVAGLKEILVFAQPQWKTLIVAAVLAILRAIGRSDEEKLHSATVNCFFFLILAGFTGFSTFLSGSLFSRVGEKLTMRMRVALFGNILRQDGEYLDKKEHAPGRLAARISTDAPNIRAAIDQQLSDVIQAFTALVGGIGIAFYYGPKMAPIGILTAGGLMLIQALLSQYLKRKGQKDAVKAEEPSRVAMEAIAQYRTVQLMNRQDFFVSKFEEGMRGPHKRALLRGCVQSFSYALSISFLFFNFAIAYRYGIHLVKLKICSPYTVFQVIESLNTASLSILAFATFMPELVRARLSAVLLFKMLSETPNIDSSCQGGVQANLSGDIKINGLYFSYPFNRENIILAGLSYTIRRGSNVALVGPSGCGKSTVFQLLQRFYDPMSGEIVFDGENLKNLNLRHFRDQLVVVGQEPVLFNYSIRENIAYGNASASQEQIENAARTANAHEFISKLPLGYSTLVGERGCHLSGGQRQRIAIARAILKNPKILLLDEATSALDANSEKIVQDALDKATNGRTCLIIAHRLSSVQKADLIVYMAGGHVEEVGNHQSLLSKGGKYAAMVQRQLLK